MQIPILSGIYTNQDSDIRTAYPRNLIPVPKQSGIATGYLRPADGIVELAATPGRDRGAINWRGVCYRASGTSLIGVAANGAVTVLGSLPGIAQVTFDYSFDRLIIAANSGLFYFDGGSISQVSDPDLGTVIDALWVDGYTMTTDGVSLVVTELNDPYSVLPTKYGSSEADPDPIIALLKLKNEPLAINRYTIEAFSNIGGEGFPFQRIDGAQIQRGAIGTHACCTYADAVAFLGSGRNEAPAIWLGANGLSNKISTREIDLLIQQYSEAELALVLLEQRVDKSHQMLYVHLPDVTVVYDIAASKELGEHVWFRLASSLVDASIYTARNMVWCYDQWIVGHSSLPKIGYLSSAIASHWGELIGWDFGTMVIYNESNGAIFHQLELICLTGRAVLGVNSTLWTSYSIDGEVWSVERAISAGKRGERNKRLVWFQQGAMRNWRIQRFRGTSDAMLSIVRLEGLLEPLAA